MKLTCRRVFATLAAQPALISQIKGLFADKDMTDRATLVAGVTGRQGAWRQFKETTRETCASSQARFENIICRLARRTLLTGAANVDSQFV